MKERIIPVTLLALDPQVGARRIEGYYQGLDPKRWGVLIVPKGQSVRIVDLATIISFQAATGRVAYRNQAVAALLMGGGSTPKRREIIEQGMIYLQGKGAATPREIPLTGFATKGRNRSIDRLKRLFQTRPLLQETL